MKKLFLTLFAVSFSLAVSAQGWGQPEIIRLDLPAGLNLYIPDPHTVLPDGEFFEHLPAWSFPGKVDPIPVIQAMLPSWVRLTNSNYDYHDVYSNYHQWWYDLEILPNESGRPRQLIITCISMFGYLNEWTLTQYSRY